MKLFLKKTLLFAFIILIALIVMELVVRAIPNDYSYKNTYLTNHASEVEILSLGSSHGYRGINPTCFAKKTFNGGHVSQSIAYDYKIWNKFKDSLTNLDTLILPISYSSLLSNLGEGSESWRVKNYVIYYGFEPKPLKMRFEILNQTPFSIAKMGLKLLLGRTNLNVNPNGFPSSDPKQSDLYATGIAASKRHTKDDLHNLEPNIALLSSLLEECRERGINVLLITTPTTHYYYDLLDQNQLALMYSTLTTIASEFENVEYYDFLMDDRFEDADFYDADHLASAGSIKLSNILNDIIEHAGQ